MKEYNFHIDIRRLVIETQSLFEIKAPTELNCEEPTIKLCFNDNGADNGAIHEQIFLLCLFLTT